MAASPTRHRLPLGIALAGVLASAGTLGDSLTDERENFAVATLREQMLSDRTDEVEAGDVTASVVWAPRVERWEVGA